MTALNPRSRERGIALLSVVAVLVLLAIIATPFLVTMRDGAQRGKAVLAEAQAAKEAETAFRVAAAYLTGTHDSAERWAKDSGVKDQPDTPDWDTLDEFQIDDTLLRNAGLDPENGRIWGVTIEDESAKINVNSAPFPLLGRFFGSTRLAEPADEAATDLNLESDGGLPARDGVVRLGDEVVQYDRREGSVLRGCKRGYKQDLPGNGPPRKHGAKALVVNEIAFQVSAYPILARRGKFDGVDRVEYAPYQNLYEMRRISDLGVAALSADEFDRVADHLTVASRGIAGHVWGDPQNLRDPIKAGEDGHKAKLRLDNPQRYGLGTLVRISDGTHTDYGVVFGYGGGALVEIVPATLHDYDANLTRVEAIIRHPVNVNTASVQVLTALFAGICRHSQEPIDADTARTVADRLVKVRSNEQQPAVRSLKDLKEILRQAVRENALRAEEATAIELNALNPMETASNRLAVGSMPMGFKSGEVFTVTARAAVLDRSGQETGRRSFRRVVDVNPQGTAVLEIAGQYDLDEMLRVSNAKHLTTYPLNVGTEDRGFASPPSRFTPFFKSDRWPSRDRTDEEASVRLLPSRLDYGTGRQAFTQPEHFDDTKHAEGHDLADGRVSFGSKDGRVAVSSDDGLEPFAAS
ncbi:MAG TPA: hypothetical protein VFS92_05965, partial [Planctomycetota bacterium]|nr:hypothetical protein [Planctomycetota bacterium]